MNIMGLHIFTCLQVRPKCTLHEGLWGLYCQCAGIVTSERFPRSLIYEHNPHVFCRECFP
jgi:hypothetical protein